VTKPKKRVYQRAVDVPKEIDDYWHSRWAEVMNERYRAEFVRAGLPGHTFTEKAPDAPNGEGSYHFGFTPDGCFEFRSSEGAAVVEWDTYELAYRALSDPTFDPQPDIAAGRCRYTKNPEHFAMAVGVINHFREALRDVIAETEKRFDVELPKYW